MKAIALRNIPPTTAKKVERKARAWNLSLDRTVLRILENALHEEDAGIRHHDLDDLAGFWSAEEAREFDEALAQQRLLGCPYDAGCLGFARRLVPG